MPYELTGLVSCFRGDESRLNLGHPGFAPALWDGCWVSKLVGKLTPGKMAEDYYLDWSAPKFERQTLYSPKGARTTAWAAAATVLTLAISLALMLWAWRRTSGRSLARMFAICLLASGAVFGVLRFALPQTAVSVYSGKRTPGAERASFWRAILGGMVYEPARKIDSCQALRRMMAESEVGNIYTGEPAREEDSPGNYTIAEKDGKVLFSLYDLGGTPVTVELPAADPTSVNEGR